MFIPFAEAQIRHRCICHIVLNITIGCIEILALVTCSPTPKSLADAAAHRRQTTKEYNKIIAGRYSNGSDDGHSLHESIALLLCIGACIVRQYLLFIKLRLQSFL